MRPVMMLTLRVPPDVPFALHKPRKICSRTVGFSILQDGTMVPVYLVPQYCRYHGTVVPVPAVSVRVAPIVCITKHAPLWHTCAAVGSLCP